jgi:hypothetical protein
MLKIKRRMPLSVSRSTIYGRQCAHAYKHRSIETYYTPTRIRDRTIRGVGAGVSVNPTGCSGESPEDVQVDYIARNIDPASC